MPIQILMPALSPTMTEGTLAKWHKKEGDTVESGDILAEIETDKATMEVEAVEEGILGKILVPDGSEGVAVNEPIALLLEDGEDSSALDGAIDSALASKTLAPAKAEATLSAPTEPQFSSAVSAGDGSRVFASPLAKRMAIQAGIDLGSIRGSGPGGRIVKHDIELAVIGGVPPEPAIAPQAAAAPILVLEPAQGAAYREQPNSGMRKAIAQRLGDAKRNIPHFYLTVDCELDGLLELRKDLNARSPEGEGAYRVSVNDFVIRAAALAIRRVPNVNVSWTDSAILLYNDIDISVAVATPGGLITPIIRKADNKGLAVISSEMKDLASRARDGKLAPEEYQGGGLTISNLGMFGVKEFSAIINPPQSVILAVGAAEPRPVVKDGALAIATVMSCTLSVDHRSVDGAMGAQYLAVFKKLIEEPLTMLL
ncbi:MAG: pyruvate dehydrogenase complex dihydrolipoamide acetyltransferase [Rhodospirillales bacterium]